MNSRSHRILCLIALLSYIMLASCALSASAAATITVRNSHDLAYDGPVTFATSIPDGFYSSPAGSADVTGGVARCVVKLSPHSSTTLRPVHALKGAPARLAVAPRGSGLEIMWDGKPAGEVELGLVVIPGNSAAVADAVAAFVPLKESLSKQTNGSLAGKFAVGEYRIDLSLMPYGGGWLDMKASVTRTVDGDEPAYVALVRRISIPNVGSERMRWSGRTIDGLALPEDYNRDWWYAHGTDWSSWSSDKLAFASVGGFTAGLTRESAPGKWVVANNYYVWERVARSEDSVYVVSEIVGPAPNAGKEGPKEAKRIYVQPLKGEPVRLSWRLAVSSDPKADWENSQMLGFAGYRKVTESAGQATVDLGAQAVEFGTSYFPYSTLCENFDFYRTPGLDRETWWPFSPTMWENWRAFLPRMETDLRIIKAMGFDWVRLHHLELLGAMDRKNAIAFLDYYAATCRKLGLKILMDTSGSQAWFTTLAGRYKDTIKRIEIENEVLIPGIKPGEPQRWTDSYNAAKKAAPDTQVFLTGNANVGMFDRLLRLGVPFDRVGLHAYKHGPGYKEVHSSIALAIGGYATSLGKSPTLGEYNWKELTRFSPEARAEEFRTIYGNMLYPRAIPEFLQFHFQETMSVNPALCRQGIRHYETIYLDRRPKPEAIEFMKLIRRYARPESPILELPVTVQSSAFAGGKTTSSFVVTNNTRRKLAVTLTGECYDDANVVSISPRSAVIQPGKSVSGTVALALKPGAKPGVYHYFVSAAYGAKSSCGWGTASNAGAPRFDASPVLADLVDYAQGPDIVNSFDWSKPTCVAFGPDAPIVEMEMAYQVYNTLQCATGRAMRLCSTADITKPYLDAGNLILIGTSASNLLVAEAKLQPVGTKGLIALQDADNGRQRLLITGGDSSAVKAAAVDFTLRFWKNAKDSSIRITGLEKGAALGNKAAVGVVNPP